ncbi:MAG: ureidoglycolate lyase [Phycisphaerae bacterium]
MKIPLLTLSAEAMTPYGTLLEWSPEGEHFQSLVQVKREVGWQLAINRVIEKSVDQIARHTNTREAFCPISGRLALLLATPDTPEQIQAFILDRPICIHPNVWHASIALTDEAQVFIAENIEVQSEVKDLMEPLEVEAG